MMSNPALIVQIQDAISTAIAEKVLPSIQNTISMQGRSTFTVEDQKSSGLQRSPGAVNPQKTWENISKISHWVLHVTIRERFLERVQWTLIQANKIATVVYVKVNNFCYFTPIFHEGKENI